MNTIHVKSALKPSTATGPFGHPPDPDGVQVAFWERNPAHPGGEVYVAGDGVVEVAETPLVIEALERKRIKKVQGN